MAGGKTKRRSAGKRRIVTLLVVVGVLLFSTSAAGGKSAGRSKERFCRTLRSMARVYMAYGEYGKAQMLAEQAVALAKTANIADSELYLCFNLMPQ